MSDYDKSNKKIFISYSGGIESTTMLLMFKHSAQAIFADTEWEFPEIYQQIDKVEQTLNIEIIKLKTRKVDGVSYDGGLPDYIKTRKFFPSIKGRYCTRAYKIEPISNFLDKHKPCCLMIGFNFDEQDRINNLEPIDNLEYVYPLISHGLTRQNCIDVLNAHNLLPEYPVYMSRGGCVGCFFKTKSEVRAMHYFIPKELDKLQELEESVQDDRNKFFNLFKNLNMPIKKYRELIDSEMFSAEDLQLNPYAPENLNTPCGPYCHR